MPSIQEALNLGDLLKYEAPNLYSRDLATVASGQNLAMGTVVGRAPVTGKLSPIDPDAVATTGDRDDALLIARHAIVASHALVWPAGITPAQKATAIAQLTARGVLVRTSA
jgi:Bacteriophage lambda head decoration protein D